MEIASPRYRRLLWVLVALALAVRLAVTARFQGLASPPDPTGYPDQVIYDTLAWRLSQGLGYTLADGQATAFRTPGTSLTLLPVYLVCGQSYLALRLWICLLSAATVPVLAWFTRRAFGEAAALWAAGILALDPGHFYYAQHFVSEVPYCLFATLATGSTLLAFAPAAGRRECLRWDVATGLFAGLATLARPQYVFVMGLFALGALVARERRRFVPQVALQSAVFVACLAPWIARNAVALGSPTLSTLSGSLFLGVHNETIVKSSLRGTWIRPDPFVTSDWPTDEVGFDRRCWQEGMEFVRARPELLPGLVYDKFRRLLSPIGGTANVLLRQTWALGWLVTAPFVVAGAFLAWRRNRLATWIVAAHVGGLLLLTLIFTGTVRYRHTVNPQLSSLAGLAVATGIELGRRAWRARTRGLAPRVESR